MRLLTCLIVLAVVMSAPAAAGGYDSVRQSDGAISALRADGNYAAALRRARQDTAPAPDSTFDYERDDAARVIATLEWAVAQDEPTRRRLARADSIDLVLDDLIQSDRFVEAFSAAVEQLSIRAELLGPWHAETLESMQRVGEIAHLSGDQNIADLAFRHALAGRAAVLGTRHPLYAETLFWTGTVDKYMGHPFRALSTYNRALGMLAPYPGRFTDLRATIMQARASSMRWDDLDQAIVMYRETLAFREAHATRPDVGVADNLTWLGWTLLHGGLHDEARTYMAGAESELRALGLVDQHLLGVVVSAQADLQAIAGNWAEAERLYRKSTAIFARSRQTHLPGFGRRKSPLHGYDALALTLYKQGLVDDAWEAMQMSKSNVSTDFLCLSQWKAREPESYARVANLRRRLLALEPGEDSWMANGTPDEDATRAFVERLVLQAEVFRMESDFLAGNRSLPVDIDGLRSRLDDRTAYVGWLSARLGMDHINRTHHAPIYLGRFLYVVRASGPVAWFPLWEQQTDRELKKRSVDYKLVTEIMSRAASWQLQVGPDARLDRMSAALYTTIFGPALRALDGIDNLVVELDQQYADTPFEMLRLPDGEFLGDRFAVCYVPSASAFSQLVGSAGSHAAHDRVALTVGDPIFSMRQLDGDSVQSSWMDYYQVRGVLDRKPEALDHLPRLPYAGLEVEKVASMFDAGTLLSGREASERRLQELASSGRLSGFDVVHIATHALIDSHPERCALALSRVDLADTSSTDGLVDAEEMMFGWKLDADLLTLSACQTARGSGPSGGSSSEMMGFTQALMGVGAHSVLASLWKVNDRATELLMTRFYEDYTGRYDDVRGGDRGVAMTKAAALREARIWLRKYRDEDGKQPYLHPIYWAGFVLTGSPY